ncbi:MAG: ABC transporter substrate-binding protein [Blastocatellia bacterium]|nr:ABC transporter substrate-binding protein [Blastocatellia bacterium]
MNYRKLLQILLPSLLIAALAGADYSANKMYSFSPPSERLTPQERRGKQIYLKGKGSSSQEIVALLGKDNTEVPGSVLTCAGCHGRDGRGKPEGGITPSDITWPSLTKPYGVAHTGGRKHPPYTERFLKRAITLGIDPAGNRLHTAMPRYRMSLDDMADLVAYLKRLGRDPDPGLSETAIRVGAILPPSERFAEMGQAIKSTLAAYFDDLNRAGGVYNRRIELSFIEPVGSPEERTEQVRAFLDDTEVFALTSGFMAGADREIAALIEEKEIPLIGAFTLHPQISFPLNRYVFYIYAGLEDQGRALAAFAAKKIAKQNPPAAIIYPDDDASRKVAEAIKQQCQKSGWETVEEVAISEGQSVKEDFSHQAALLARNLSRKAVEVVFFLGPAGAESIFLREAQRLDWKPLVLVPGPLAGRDIFEAPMSFEGRIFLSFPTLPSDQTPDGVAQYRILAEAHKLQPKSLATQFTALSSAKLMVEGFKRAGKDVSREKLIEVLEGLYGFSTGLTPAVTYNPNRRVGAIGSHIVRVDLKAKSLAPASEWVELK